MGLKERVARLEGGLRADQLTVCRIEGGGTLSASYDGLCFTPEPGECPSAFETRMTQAASDAGALFLCIGTMIEDDLMHYQPAAGFDPSRIPDEERGTFDPTPLPSDDLEQI